MHNVMHKRISRGAIGSMAKYSLLALSLGLMACETGQQDAKAQGHAADLSCGAALDSLMSEWRSIRFAEPSKPAQMIVSGQHGYSIPGGPFNYMRTQIRLAARDCEQGRDAEALVHIQTVRDLLDRDHHI
jgi:hypothetical protein